MQQNSFFPGILVNDVGDLQTGSIYSRYASFLRIVGTERNIPYEYSTDLIDLGNDDLNFVDLFTSYYITEYSERHVDGGAAVSTLADTFIFNSTGAFPVELSVTGYVSKLVFLNHRNIFINMYNNILRGSTLQKSDKVVELGIKNTLYTCYPINLNWVEDTAHTDYSMLSLNLISYKYISLPSFIKVFYEGDLVTKVFKSK